MYDETKPNFERYEMHLISLRLEHLRMSDAQRLLEPLVGITRERLIADLKQLDEMEALFEAKSPR